MQTIIDKFVQVVSTHLRGSSGFFFLLKAIQNLDNQIMACVVCKWSPQHVLCCEKKSPISLTIVYSLVWFMEGPASKYRNMRKRVGSSTNIKVKPSPHKSLPGLPKFFCFTFQLIVLLCRKSRTQRKEEKEGKWK